jgi:hypothetical protein
MAILKDFVYNGYGMIGVQRGTQTKEQDVAILKENGFPPASIISPGIRIPADEEHSKTKIEKVKKHLGKVVYHLNGVKSGILKDYRVEDGKLRVLLEGWKEDPWWEDADNYKLTTEVEEKTVEEQIKVKISEAKKYVGKTIYHIDGIQCSKLEDIAITGLSIFYWLSWPGQKSTWERAENWQFVRPPCQPMKDPLKTIVKAHEQHVTLLQKEVDEANTRKGETIVNVNTGAHGIFERAEIISGNAYCIVTLAGMTHSHFFIARYWAFLPKEQKVEPQKTPTSEPASTAKEHYLCGRLAIARARKGGVVMDVRTKQTAHLEEATLVQDELFYLIKLKDESRWVNANEWSFMSPPKNDEEPAKKPDMEDDYYWHKLLNKPILTRYGNKLLEENRLYAEANPPKVNPPHNGEDESTSWTGSDETYQETYADTTVRHVLTAAGRIKNLFVGIFCG